MRFLAMVGLWVLWLAGCATAKAPTPARVEAEDQRLAIRNQGYSLLYQLMSDEKDVSKLLVIKKEAEDVGSFLKDVSKTAGEAAKELEQFAKADAHLHLKMDGLPLAEKQTRDLIAKTHTKELVGKTGEKFELRILLTQAESLTYGAHLAVVTESNETNAERRKFLEELSRKLQEQHQRLIDLMHMRWNMPAK